MKLADYLCQYRMTPTQFGRLLGVTSRSTVHRYINGDRIPTPRVLQRINHITSGVVTLDDFLDEAVPKCATVHHLLTGERVVRFPWSRGFLSLYEEDAYEYEQESDFSPPVQQALLVLKDRVQKNGGEFVLDGIRTDARGIVRVANRILTKSGHAEIAYPGL